MHTATIELDGSFARELAELAVEWEPTPVSEPRLLALNDGLARSLGLDAALLRSPRGIALLAGNATPSGSKPIAMAYAGHQFGNYSPRLGDGRAVLLGELLDGSGQRHDVHLKGSGRTPFARGGDGKAVVGPMLREFLIAEAMHTLHIPTTRALAVVATGEPVARETLLPGAILTRVASSHLRVGTFEYAARLDDPAVLQRLADHSIARHYPALTELDAPYLALLEAVVDAQASVVARWMLVGFIHGVMNTDNMTISGETIDYGPYAFMDRYDPSTVFSSIDHMGRYAFGNQPSIAQWNLTRLAETLLSLIDPDVEAAKAAALDVLQSFPDRFHRYWDDGMRAKLGLIEPDPEDHGLFEAYLELLKGGRVDLTTSFRLLARTLRGDAESLRSLIEVGEADTVDLDGWTARWRRRLGGEGRDELAVAAAMDGVNPIYVPRNHLVEQALSAATDGDLAPFEELLDAVTSPFEERDGLERFAGPAGDLFDKGFKTYCGT